MFVLGAFDENAAARVGDTSHPHFLTGCAGLFFVHDPATGVISAGQIPNLLKSLRCELITFYQIQRVRRDNYKKVAVTDPARAFDQFAYFNIGDTFFGVFVLELKVTDVAGLGPGTAFDIKKAASATTSDVTHFGPTLGSQGIYDLTWNFLIRQDATLAKPDPNGGDAQRGCYSLQPSTLQDLEDLGANKNPQLSNFYRISVNGTKTLSEWLRDNATMLSAQSLVPDKTEAVEPAQMYYQFALQASVGLEGRYSLTSTAWSPLAVQEADRSHRIAM